MTPKEKADELIHKFSPLVTIWDCYNDCPEDEENIIEDAKKCALVVVDEILLEVSHGRKLDWIKERRTGEDSIEYWLKVKAELINPTP